MKTTLSDVVLRTSVKCQPEISSEMRWVGADHVDEGDFKVRRWSTTDDPLFPPTFKFRVPAGSVLLHSRNPKKVATLDFDAITGEKFFCLVSADPQVLDSRFLALQLQSSHFTEYVSRWMSGSVNKFLNWSALANYEFELPSLDQQARLVELISEIDEQITRIEALTESGNRVVSAIISNSLYKVSSPWPMSNLDEVCKNGLFNDGDWVESKDQDPAGENRLLQLADIGTLKFLDKSNRWMNNEQFKRLRCTELLEKDVLIARMPDPIGRACLMPSGQPRSATVVDVSIARPDQSIVIPEYLVLAVNGPKFHQAVVTNTVGTTRPRIARSKLGKIEFPLPPLPKQISIVDRVDEAMAQIEKAETARLATISLRKSLINSELS